MLHAINNDKRANHIFWIGIYAGIYPPICICISCDSARKVENENERQNVCQQKVPRVFFSLGGPTARRRFQEEECQVLGSI